MSDIPDDAPVPQEAPPAPGSPPPPAAESGDPIYPAEGDMAGLEAL